MTNSVQQLEEMGTTFSRFYEDRDLDAIRRLYHDDAVFISPNPPGIHPDFGTTLVGRDEILRLLEATLEVAPAGTMTTLGLYTGIDMSVWVWQAPGVRGTDVMMFDEDGLIVRHHVTAPRPDDEAGHT